MLREAVPLYPKHNHHVVVFGGTGAELLHSPISPIETLNDLNGDIVNAFRVARHSMLGPRLRAKLATTAYSRLEFEEALYIIGSGLRDPLWRAWAVLIVGNQARAGIDPTIANVHHWGYGITTPATNGWPKLPDTLEALMQRVKKVQLTNWPWEDVLDRFDAPGTFFTIDPPYPFYVRASYKAQYKHEMTDVDHERLLLRLRRLVGKAMIFCYDNPVYRELLADWRCVKVRTRCMSSPIKGSRTECIWVNY